MFGCSIFVSFLPFLAISWGPVVGRACHRRRHCSLVDGHDAPLTIPLLLFCLLLASKLLYLALATFLAGSRGSSGGERLGNGFCLCVGMISFGELPLPLFSLTSSVFFVGTVSFFCRYSQFKGFLILTRRCPSPDDRPIPPHPLDGPLI